MKNLRIQIKTSKNKAEKKWEKKNKRNCADHLLFTVRKEFRIISSICKKDRISKI